MSLRISELPAVGTIAGSELVELSQLSTTITLTAATISADSTTNSFHDSAGGFITAGFAVGQSIKSSGFTGSVANNKNARVITELTATDMVFGGTDGDDIVTDAAGESVTLTSWVSVRALASDFIIDAMVFKGVIDCSTNPNYPAGDRGDTYRISVAGKIGGASGINVEVGDLLTCMTDGTVTGDQAAVGAQWTITQANLDGAVFVPGTPAEGDLLMYNGTAWELLPKGAEGEYLAVVPVAFGGTGLPEWTNIPSAPEAWGMACSDETTAITADAVNPKHTFVTPYGFHITDIKASLGVAQTSGALFTIDVKCGGVSLFSTLLTFDNGEQGTFLATTPMVLANDPTDILGNARIDIYVTQVGDGTAKGLKVYFVGYFILGGTLPA